MRNSRARLLTHHNTSLMKTLIAIIIFGWLAVVTFCGPELYRFIDRVLPDEAPAKVVRRHR